MSSTNQAIHAILHAILCRKETYQPDMRLTTDMRLYDRTGGLGLDSLETAELSVRLEKQFGRDPYSAGLIVQTVGELEDYYARNGSTS